MIVELKAQTFNFSTDVVVLEKNRLFGIDEKNAEDDHLLDENIGGAGLQ